MKKRDISKAEQRLRSSHTRQAKKELKHYGKGENTTATAPVPRNKPMIGKALLTLNQMVDGLVLDGSLSINEEGQMEDKAEQECSPEVSDPPAPQEESFSDSSSVPDPFYRPRAIEVPPPYSQKVFDSLAGAPQGGVNYRNCGPQW